LKKIENNAKFVEGRIKSGKSEKVITCVDYFSKTRLRERVAESEGNKVGGVGV